MPMSLKSSLRDLSPPGSPLIGYGLALSACRKAKEAPKLALTHRAAHPTSRIRSFQAESSLLRRDCTRVESCCSKVSNCSCSSNVHAHAGRLESRLVEAMSDRSSCPSGAVAPSTAHLTGLKRSSWLCSATADKKRCPGQRDSDPPCNAVSKRVSTGNIAKHRGMLRQHLSA